MKKHILSYVSDRYPECVNEKKVVYSFATQTTVGLNVRTEETRSIEHSDPDEYKGVSNKFTTVTEAIETSDADEFQLLGTYSNQKNSLNGHDSKSTNSIENSDPDEFRLNNSTTNTFTIETSDPDEFWV